jgi:dihydroorotate dehydrogenase (fumarate)
MDLSTTYMGLKLKNPLVAGSSPLSQSVDKLKALEDEGMAAIVVHSIFEEQLRHEAKELAYHAEHGTESFAEALSYFPEYEDYRVGPEDYLKNISQAKEALDIPVIGSLNGVTVGGWTDYAKQIEQAGADALELNVYYLPTGVDTTGQEVEKKYLDILSEVKKSISLPVAMKVGPFFSSIPNMGKKLDEAGADALVLFNRFYQPDFDLDELEVVPNLVLSNSDELRLPLRWIAILYGQIKANMALTTGAHTSLDVLKSTMAGADVTMMTSALLKEGPGVVSEVLRGMQAWMEEHEYDSVAQMKGSLSQKSAADPEAFERANYMKTLNSYK